MAAINDLINQIADVDLRERIQREVDKLNKQKKFGLVFEEHLPECTPLYDMPIKRGCNVMLRNSKEDKSVYVVLYTDGETAMCARKNDKEAEKVNFSLNDIVRVAEFGEPIYPYLKPIDSVCNASDSNLWHMLIEADNYHALQLLEYLYAGKVDCIYIDPPYNTGAKDWKYNNDYVDGSDAYRHSKWLSFMEKRLYIAKRLLNPENSTLIIAIDDKEVHHLGCILEDIFREAQIQMITTTISPAGVGDDNLFNKTNEFLFYVMIGSARVYHPQIDGTESEVSWLYLHRRDYSSRRGAPKGGTAQFYPIYVDNDAVKIVKIGEPIPPNVSRFNVPQIPNCTAVFPVRPDGTEMNWSLTPTSLQELLNEKVVKASRNNNGDYVIRYLSASYREKIKSGEWIEVGHHEDGSRIIVNKNGHFERLTTVWNYKTHNSKEYGSRLVRDIIGNGRFSYPKSLYAVYDSLRYVVQGKPNALIVDFFAGSGTTMHAVSLLNEEDGGKRRCICVTNNEVSALEEKELEKNGVYRGSEAWNKIGIARYATWPRIVCSIKGNDVNGKPLKGKYITNDRSMSDGLSANASFYKLGFLDKTSVALGMCFREMLPTLWMKAGAVGKCPEVEDGPIPDFLLLPDNRFAVLINENAFAKFAEILPDKPEIQTVFINTDYEVNYRAMAKDLNVATTYQLYRDYLDHFRINHGRN